MKSVSGFNKVGKSLDKLKPCSLLKEQGLKSQKQERFNQRTRRRRFCPPQTDAYAAHLRQERRALGAKPV